MTKACAVLLGVVCALPAAAQNVQKPKQPVAKAKADDNHLRKGYFELYGGMIRPNSNTVPSGVRTDGAPSFGLGGGYRPSRFFQLDAGCDFFGGALGINRSINVRNTQTGATGVRDVKDSEALITTGGRLILPLFKDRILISAGGGMAYLTYFEHGVSEGYEVIKCTSCRSRGGWGPYQQGQVLFVVDHGRHVGLGATFKVAEVSTGGSLLNGARSRERWQNLSAVVSFRF